MSKAQKDEIKTATEDQPKVETVQPVQPPAPSTQKHKFLHSKVLLIVILVLLASLPSMYFYQKSRQAEANLNNPDTSKKAVVDAVAKKVGKIILLPTDEQPTLATVPDHTKVASQPFFRNAADGDMLLVYSQSRQAFLYRPSQNKIIAVAQLNVNGSDLNSTKQ